VSFVFQAALLGVVQGLTEFLPVSSSAHLILARAMFGFDGDKFGLSFDVACHLGTLVAVLVYFRRESALMIASIPRLFGSTEAAHHGGKAIGFHASSAARPGPTNTSDGARLIWLLVVGTIPATVVGALFKRVIEDHLRTPAIAVTMLAAGAMLFFVAERVGSQDRGEDSLTLADAFWIGCAQAVALVPGVSRSGATITVALILGLLRPEAARFIFLLGIPAILGAAVSEAPKALRAGMDGDIATLFVVGIITSAIVGYIAVKSFIRYLANHSLDVFAWYRLALAGAAGVWLWKS
jgi:undecaprenyl-diphosphatase